MRIVVTGGSGLIGRAVVSALVARGDEVRVTSRDPDSVRGLPPAVERVRWDGLSAEQATPLVDGAGAVVHLAGAGIADRRWTAARKRAIRESRTRSTAALAEAIGAAARPPATLLQASAVGYYGSRGDEELDESAEPGSGFLAEVCVDWERAGGAVDDLGVRRVVLRTGVVLAAEGGALPRMVLPFKWFAGGPVGDGGQWVPWIHLADEVGSILHLLDMADARGIFNLTAPEPITNRALSEAIGRVLRRPSFLPAPKLALRLALGEMAELVLASQKVVPSALLAAGYPFRFRSAPAALEDLLG